MVYCDWRIRKPALLKHEISYLQNTKALNIYCAGHNLDLVIQGIMKDDRDFEQDLEIANGDVNYIRKSPKRLSAFMKAKHDESTLLPFVHSPQRPG